MDFKQSYKGIFQFESQAMLEMAMAEIQAEAMEADAMGLQDSYHAEGVMLLNIDAVASDQDWDEMSTAVATLAMHASKGFLYATAIHEGQAPVTEYYSANTNDQPPAPDNSAASPAQDADYFPLVKGRIYTFDAKNRDTDTVQWRINTVHEHGRDFFYFSDPELEHFHYSDYWHNAFFSKDKSLISTVYASSIEELRDSDFSDPYTSQVVYNNQGKPGEELYTVWNQSNIFAIFIQEGFVDLDLPAGNFKDCMKVRAELYHVDGAHMHIETQYQYFAKGVGVVKWEKGSSSLDLAGYTG